MKNIIFSVSFILFQLINYSQALPKRNSPITDGTPIKLQNSIYTITPPNGYLYMPQYASFMNNEKETSITVTEHDSSSYYMMVTAVLKSDFSKQRMQLIDQEELNDGKGFTFTFLFNVQNIPVERMIYIKGDSKKCVVVNCNYKQVDKIKYLGELKESAFSISE